MHFFIFTFFFDINSLHFFESQIMSAAETELEALKAIFGDDYSHYTKIIKSGEIE
jgi:hypothetical protein